MATLHDTLSVTVFEETAYCLDHMVHEVGCLVASAESNFFVLSMSTQ